MAQRWISGVSSSMMCPSSVMPPVLGLAMAMASLSAHAPPCTLSVADRGWIQQALDGWETTANSSVSESFEVLETV